MPHFLLIHSPIGGHWGCFHVWAIVNKAAVNMGLEVALQAPDIVFFGYIFGNRMAGSYGSSSFSVWGTSILLHNGCPVSITISSAWRFPFLHSHSFWCTAVPQCGLDLHFPDHQWCLAPCSVPVGWALSSLSSWPLRRGEEIPESQQ